MWTVSRDFDIEVISWTSGLHEYRAAPGQVKLGPFCISQGARGTFTRLGTLGNRLHQRGAESEGVFLAALAGLGQRPGHERGSLASGAVRNALVSLGLLPQPPLPLWARP